MYRSWSSTKWKQDFWAILFEDHKAEQLQTITSDTYLDMLTRILLNNTYPDEWFQQDGATAHTARG